MQTLINHTLRSLLVLSLLLPFITFAQSESETIPEPPAQPVIMADIKTEQDYNSLTQAQKNSISEYYDSMKLYYNTYGDKIARINEQISTSSEVKSSNVVDCFDYYKFGSVQVQLSAVIGQTVPGAPIFFAGMLKNENPYPVVEGSVYVKIFKITDQDDDVIKKDGYPMVDQFALPETYFLPANSETETSFEWEVPANAEDGEYFAAFYFQSAKRYNLLGLSFTDDVTGNQAHFSVTNPTQTKIVAFDKTAVTLNDQPHAFAAFPQHFTKDEPVKASVVISNPTNEAVTVSLNWKLYDWDSLRPNTLTDTKSEIVELKAGERRSFTYDVEPIDYAVSYLVAEMKDGYSSSFLNIRFVRDGIAETRINFPSIMSFPLVAGQETSVFSCVHSTNVPLVPNNVLALTLRDRDNNVIHTYEYQGDITGAMMGIADTFVPTESYDYFTLTALLSRNGQTIEEVVQTYDCAQIDASSCIQPEVEATAGVFDFMKNIKSLLMILLAIIGLGFAAKYVWDKQNVKFVGLFLLLIVGLSTGAGEVEAKSVTWSISGLPELMYYWGNLNTWEYNPTTDPILLSPWTGGDGWSIGLEKGASASVIYKAEVVYSGTDTVVPDGTSLSIGTKVKIRQIARKNTDISWNGTGVSGDSPYGRWVTGAGPMTDAGSSVGCSPGSFTGDYYSGAIIDGEDDYYKTYTHLHVNPPTPTISSSNFSCTGGVCTVTGAGDISLTMTFPDTYGRFYVRYIDPLGDKKGCWGTNVPLHTKNFIFGVTWLYRDTCEGLFCNFGVTYDLPVGSKEISFSFKGYDPNTPPSTPTLTGPATGYTGQSLSFTAKANDAEGDNIHYLFDWNNDTVGDQWGPAWPDLVNSGIGLALPHSWSADGTYYLRVKAADSSGSYSDWSTAHEVKISTAGSCGVANGATLTAAPATGLCLTGTPTAVSGVSHGPYSWTCKGSNGGPDSAVCVTVPAPPTVTFWSDPDMVTYRHQSRLHWTVDGATSCTASGGTDWASPSSDKTHSGSASQLVTPQTSTVYELLCTGNGGPTKKTAAVGIYPPVVNLSADSTHIDINTNTVIRWSVQGATSCDASGGIDWTGTKTFDGSDNQTILLANHTTTYNLICTGPGGTTPATPVTVLVPEGDIHAVTCEIPFSGSDCEAKLTWNSYNFLSTPKIYQGSTFLISAATNPVPYMLVNPNPDNDTFTLKDDGKNFSISTNALSHCADGSVWVSAIATCLKLPEIWIDLDQDLIRNGDIGTGNININADYSLNCSIVGAKVAGSNTFRADPKLPLPSVAIDYPFTTDRLTSAQRLQVKCEHVDYSVVNGEANSRINVTASVEER